MLSCKRPCYVYQLMIQHVPMPIFPSPLFQCISITSERDFDAAFTSKLNSIARLVLRYSEGIDNFQKLDDDLKVALIQKGFLEVFIARMAYVMTADDVSIKVEGWHICSYRISDP